LKASPQFYAVVNVLGRPYLVTKNDKVILNRVNNLELGDEIRLHNVHEIGSKDYALQGRPYVNPEWMDVRAVVVEHPKSRMVPPIVGHHVGRCLLKSLKSAKTTDVD
jgi:ribosomal protein L21